MIGELPGREGRGRVWDAGAGTRDPGSARPGGTQRAPGSKARVRGSRAPPEPGVEELMAAVPGLSAEDEDKVRLRVEYLETLRLVKERNCPKTQVEFDSYPHTDAP